MNKKYYVFIGLVLLWSFSGCDFYRSRYERRDTLPEKRIIPAPVTKNFLEAFTEKAGIEEESGSLRLNLKEAVLQSLRQNRSFIVEKMNPEITRIEEEKREAVFDPVLNGKISLGKNNNPLDKKDEKFKTTNSADLSLTADKITPEGTTLQAGVTSRLEGGDSRTNRIGLSLTQALLQGQGEEVNLVSLRQAQIETRISEYELRGFAENLIAQVEGVYWDYVLAEKQIAIVERSLLLAEQQWEETRERIKVGKLAEVELAAAQAEVALRKEALINAKSNLETTRLKFLRLINPPGENIWGREIILQDSPETEEIKLDDLEDHVRLALKSRPDLNQTKLQIERGDLELVRTKNGLLPRLDLFLNLGKSGYSDSFGESLKHIGGQGYDFQIGLTGQFPWENRSAQASDRRALWDRQKIREAWENLLQLVQTDVRGAYLEAVRLQEQITATAATRLLQEEKLRAETEKFRIGKSTTFLVGQAQRDLLQAQNNEIQARVNYLKAVVDLYRLEGSLLFRRGINAPGIPPIELSPFHNGK